MTSLALSAELSAHSDGMRRVMLLGALAATLALSGPAGGQTPERTTPLAQALVDRDGDFVPDRLGDSLTITGTVTTRARTARGSLRYVVVQEGRSTVRVLARRESGLIDSLAPGMVIRVRGELRHYRGAEELGAERIDHLGTAPLPEPVTVLVVDLVSERYVGQRVRVVGELTSYVVTDAAQDSDRDFELSDRSGTISVRIPAFVDSDSAERVLRGGPVELVALAEQSDRTAPYDSGYRLNVDRLEDIRFRSQPPYGALGVLGLIAGLVGVVAYSVRRRKAAERRAREMERLYADLKRSDEALRESVEWNQRAFDNVAVGVAHIAADGRWLRVNPQLCSMLGYPPEELLACSVEDVTHPDDHLAHSEAQRALWDGRIHSFTRQKRYIRKDGQPVWADVTVSIVRETGGDCRHFIAVAADITHRKQLEEQLRQSQKMEAVGQLAGGIAHDFNNLLTVITNYSAMLLEMTDASSSTAADLREIKTAGERAVGLTRQLLAFSRKQLLQPRVLDLNAVSLGLAPMLRRLIGEDIRIDTTTDPNLGPVLADPGQIEQVIMNLTVNARDAMPGGGTLTIETSNVDLGGWQTEEFRTDVPPGAYVMLAISDTGCGMDSATQARVFEPFFTTKEPGKGTGLGLATVYGIVKQSGGFIWLYSELGKGTTFKVYLPRAATPQSQTDGAGSVSPRPRGVEVILLVEDEDAVRRLTGRMLMRQGYSVLEARNGAEALRLAREAGRQVDLVVTDIVMPEMNGSELAIELRTLHPDLQVIFMSGYTDDDIVRRGLLDPDVIFIQKPFTADILARVVREVLDNPEPALLP